MQLVTVWGVPNLMFFSAGGVRPSGALCSGCDVEKAMRLVLEEAVAVGYTPEVSQFDMIKKQ